MFNNEGYSLADIAAATNNNARGGMFGDDWAWIIILLLCGWGGGGFGFGGRDAAATTSVRDEISYGFTMNNLENGVRGIQQGLCDGFYAMNTGMLNGFNGVGQAINNSATAITAQITGLAADNAACCCAIQNAVNTQACETRHAIADSTREILDFLAQDKIATLTAENQSLKFAASQIAQNNYLVSALKDPCPVPAYVVPNPYGAYSTCGTC